MLSELRNTDKKNWHAIYVASRQEKNTGRLLSEKGIESYVPLVKTMRQWSDRKKMVEFPLLNGYVFVRVMERDREKVLQTKGAVNFVRSEGKIALVRDTEIERLKQLITLGYQLEVNAIQREYKEGEKVKIAAGTLKGMEGFITEHTEGRFITVLLESISQSIRVKVPKEVLITADLASH